MKAKLDEASRIVIPGNIRDMLGLKPNDEVIVKKMEDKELISKLLGPEEFLEEAHILAEDIKRTKVREIDPLKIKNIP
jgi:AbrB family looped-hinge helix DNA binding protein